MKSEAKIRPLKELAREIFSDVLAEVEVARAFDRKLGRCGSVLHFGCESVDLARFERRWVVSFGKAAWAMLEALRATLGEEFAPERGVVVSNIAPQNVQAGFQAFQGGHPVPNDDSQRGAEAILELLRGADESTLVFFLISGGGSALVEKPLVAGVTLEDMKRLNKVLVGCGASIGEINTVRKHLSAVKGGRLAEAAARAHQVTLLLSDVPEGRPEVIASGPTLPDPSTVETCYEVAARYKLIDQFPRAIRELFEKRSQTETPKPGAAAFAHSQAFVVLSNHDVLHAAHRAAGARGFLAECELCCDDWPYDRAAALLLQRVEEMQRANPGQPVALISGGEVLVTVTGDGRGGRNQHYVLHLVERIAGREMAVLSAGTDGVDGNSPATGAAADGETLTRAQALGLHTEDFLRRSDSGHFFEALGDAIVIGPQQNNLRDLRLLLAR